MSGRRYPSAEERFWSKVRKSENCWEWTGRKDTGGYGTLSIDGRGVAAHRFSFELLNGPIPQGQGHHGTCVCHSCDNRSCVNPAHLFLGTHTDNMRDAFAKERFDRKGVKHPRAKLTDNDIRSIRVDGRLLREIADDYGIGTTQACAIRNRKAWIHVI